jgi:hypothetical protein
MAEFSVQALTSCLRYTSGQALIVLTLTAGFLCHIGGQGMLLFIDI